MATKKLTQLTAGIPEAGDIVYVVKDPTGTPLDRKVDVSNLGLLKSGAITLNDAQIKGLPTGVPIEVVSAPGMGKVLIPVQAMVVSNFSAGAYSGVDADSYIAITIDDIVSNPLYGSGFFDSTQAQVGMIGFPTLYYEAGFSFKLMAATYFRDDVENVPLNILIFNSMDFGNGHANNQLEVRILYYEWELGI